MVENNADTSPVTAGMRCRSLEGVAFAWNNTWDLSGRVPCGIANRERVHGEGSGAGQELGTGRGCPDIEESLRSCQYYVPCMLSTKWRRAVASVLVTKLQQHDIHKQDSTGMVHDAYG